MRIDRGAVPNLPPNGVRETRISVVLVEDHALLRDGLKALLELESDVEIIGEFGCVESSADCIQLCRTPACDADGLDGWAVLM